MILTSFLIFISLILLVGLYAKRFSNNTTADYLIASGQIPVWQTVLSALASNYSGFMYTGLIGYTYLNGVSGIWLMVAWVLGEMVVMIFAPKKINQVAKKQNLKSYNALLSRYWGVEQIGIRKIAAIITLIFLSIYAAAQFSAAGKILHNSLELPVIVGVLLTYAIVLAYCFSGGIRASIWTDSIQFVVMLFSIAVLVFSALSAIGGWDIFIKKLHQNPEAYTQFFPNSMGSFTMIVLFFIGWAASGLGVIGQPHISIRFISMRHTKKYTNMLLSYYVLAVSFTALCLLSALLAKVYFTGIVGDDFDAEVALPQLAELTLHPIMVGLILAGLLSAIISTADSQILSSSASLGTDLLKKHKDDKANLRQNKFTTVLIATFALLVTLYGSQSVFSLVVVAWSGLAAAFTPLLLIYFLGYQPTQKLSIAIMLSGLSAAVIWRLMGLNEIVYDALPGILTGFLVFLVAKLFIPVVKNKTS